MERPQAPVPVAVPRAPAALPQPERVARLPFREDLVGGQRVSASGEETLRYRHFLGALEFPCMYCGALLFRDELHSNRQVTCSQCCNMGKVRFCLYNSL